MKSIFKKLLNLSVVLLFIFGIHLCFSRFLTAEEPAKEEIPEKEKPKAQEPNKEEPKTEEPKKEEPKKEEPKKEEPKTETPKENPPKEEIPKSETDKSKPEVIQPEQKDVIPPARITDLAANTGTSDGEIFLQWKAVGDNDISGTAAAYIVKYSVSKITTKELFDAASEYIQNWIPISSGEVETRTLSGLAPKITYYISIAAKDNVSNQSEYGNTAFAETFFKIKVPAAITDLTALSGASDGEIILKWTAVGEDDNIGSAKNYIVKYSTSMLTSAVQFENASEYVQTWMPLASGQSENRTLAGLTPLVTYSISIEAINIDLPLLRQGKASNIAQAAAFKKAVIAEVNPDKDNNEGIGISFPLESRLDITGRKSVGFKYSGTRYFGNPPEGSAGRQQVTSTFTLEQELQVKLTGTIAKRVTVNVDYDDTKEQQRDISVVYQGKEEEFIQEAAFGDITLTLPNTEFTGYNKKMFGAELKAKLGKFRVTAIGAQTKGITKTVTFSGGYTPVKADINDTSYIKNKYYIIYLDQSHLPITPGTEQIWIDDQDGTNNNFPPSYPSDRGKDVTQYTQKTTPDSLYSLDYKNPGSNYTIDYNTGIIVFKSTVNSNNIIAVAYKYKSGTASVGYDSNSQFDFAEANLFRIQSSITDVTHQLQNFYSIGQRNILPREYDRDFKLVIYNNNNQEVDVSKYPYSIDYEFGILQFTGSKQPFANDIAGNVLDPNAYNISNPQSKYKLHIEYKYKFQTYKLPDFNIVKLSEKVVMDSQELRRDVDYWIDYEFGFIGFFNQDKITENTNVTITYEYLPFGGQFQSNLFGTRGEIDLTDNLFVGSSFIYMGNQTPVIAPTVDSTPSDLSILDVDSRLSFNEKHTKDFSDFTGVPRFFVPTNINVSAELAKSNFNPNTYRADNGETGVGMLDGMEGIDNISGASTSKGGWFYSSVPVQDASVNINNRSDPIVLTETEDFGHDVSSYAGRKILLNLAYDFANGRWDSIVTTLSKSGTDYTRYNFVEIWMKADWNADVDVSIDLGVVNEDMNGSFLLDTEDTNLDGKLNPGEDNGMNGIFGGKTTVVGANNGYLDSEDLDRNGRLDQIDSYYTFTFNLATLPTSFVSRQTGDWKLIKIPRASFVSSTPANPPDIRYVKHMRVFLKNTTGKKGTITVESIQLTGNKWELKGNPTAPSKFDIKAISGDIDNSYESLVGIFFKPLTEAEKKREQSLSIAYTMANETFYAQRVFTKAQDLLNYGIMRFDLFKKLTHTGDVLFIRLGADESNYYQYEIPLDAISAKWHVLLYFLF